MEDWKNRLVEEYRQTKERYEKLKAYNNKCEIEDRTNACCVSPDMKEARRKDVDTVNKE